MNERCKHIGKDGFRCGSHAFNLYKDDIEQGDLCDVHYWQAKAQSAQKPVALPLVQFEKVAEGIEVGYDVFGGVDIRLGGEFVYVHINYDYRYTHNAERKALAKQIVGLLTTPPQRTWQGLTDEENWQIATDCTIGGDLHADKFARAIESRLKERNT